MSFLPEHRVTFPVSLKAVTSNSKRLFIQPLHLLFSPSLVNAHRRSHVNSGKVALQGMCSRGTRESSEDT